MTKVKALKATARPGAGTGAARAVRRQGQAPGVKRGGTVNIVEHSVEVHCPADAIPDAIDVDLTGLEINRSVHLSELTLPENVRAVTRRDVTLVTIVAPSGYLEEQKAAAEAAAAAAAAAPAAPGAAPPAGAAAAPEKPEKK